MSTSPTADNEEICCGSGCTNCVLDLRIDTIHRNRSNILSSGYTKFVLASVTKRTWNVFEFTFQFHLLPSDDATLDIPPGSSLMLRMDKNPRTNKEISHDFDDFIQFEKDIPSVEHAVRVERHDTTTEDLFISRFYTPIHHNSDKLNFKVLVKFEPHGAMTQHWKTIRVGDTTEWKGAFSKVPHDLKMYDSIVCYCNGVAISTIYSLMKSFVDDDNCDTIVHVFACFKDTDSILLRDELGRLNGYWNFHSTIYLAHERASKARYNETILCGERISKIDETDDETDRRKYLLCGSEKFTDAIKYLLSEKPLTDIEIL